MIVSKSLNWVKLYSQLVSQRESETDGGEAVVSLLLWVTAREGGGGLLQHHFIRSPYPKPGLVTGRGIRIYYHSPCSGIC